MKKSFTPNNMKPWNSLPSMLPILVTTAFAQKSLSRSSEKLLESGIIKRIDFRSDERLTLETLVTLRWYNLLYQIRSDYPNFLCFNSTPTQHQFL